MRIILLLCFVLLLAGCDALEANARRAGHDIKKSYDKTRYKVSDLIYRKGRSHPLPLPALPPRYCYRVQMDILCYDHPKEGLRSVLVGAQGDFYGGADEIGVQALEEQREVGDAVQSGTIRVSENPLPDNAPFHTAPSPSVVDDESAEEKNLQGLDANTGMSPPAPPIDLMSGS